MRRSIDYPFLLATGALVIVGFLVFLSASLGLLTRSGGAAFSQVAANQFLFGVVLGTFGAYFISRIDYRRLRPFAFYFFLFSVALTLLVFVPGLGLEINGAHRWLDIFGFSFQPSELLKLSAVIYLASLFASLRSEVGKPRGVVPLLLILLISAVVLLIEPDTDTLLVLGLASVSMYFAAGGRKRYILGLLGLGLLSIAALAFARPYLMDRFITFIDPSRDPQGSGYQIQQSLIAVGSGGLFGKGFGESTQKFSFLPEPIGDSIFAVAAEEFGLWGSLSLLLLFFAFLATGLRIAARAPDLFGGLAVSGLVILIAGQSFINIASLVGLFPLTGMPLLFVSHGGTALLMALLEVGFILSVSRHMKKS